MRILPQSIAVAILASAALPALAQQNVLPPIPRGSISLQLTPVVTGLAAPDYGISPPGDSRLFVVEQNGRIFIYANGTLSSSPALDIQSLVSPPLNLTNANDERGLLGLAFHPGFSNPSSPGYRKLYTFNSQAIGTGSPTFPAPNNATQGYKNVINEWRMNIGDPNSVDIASRREVLSIGKNANNHNGGTIAFGPDGYLYLALGDGGNANDTGPSHIEPGGNGMNLTTVFGKMLRIDPLHPSFTPASNDPVSTNGEYRVAAGNPLLGPGQHPEIYAIGFRNPYRFAFDRVSGDLIMADVGQNTVEEINRVVRGGNYGWPVKEGTFLFNRVTSPSGTAGSVGARSPGLPAGYIDPISGPCGTLEYDHDDGISITGGFVYRGSRMPALYGKYIFGDLALRRTPVRADGRLFYADLNSGEVREFSLPQFAGNILPGGQTIHGFGEDSAGEIYVMATNSASGGTGGVMYSMKLSPTVWSGPAFAFSKASGANPSLAANQDRITSNVWITRASTQGIYNAKSETGFIHNLSPAGTEWATGTTANYASLTYTNWEQWTGGAGGGPPSKVGVDAVLHLIEEDIYMDIKFTNWGGSGGAFSYLRSTPALTPRETWRQLHFGSTADAGNAADLVDPDGDGLANLVEFAFGLNPLQGGSISLPQPVLSGGNYTVSFTQPAGVSGVTYRVRWSNRLTPDSWTQISDTGTSPAHTFTVPAGNSRLYFQYAVCPE